MTGKTNKVFERVAASVVESLKNDISKLECPGCGEVISGEYVYASMDGTKLRCEDCKDDPTWDEYAEAWAKMALSARVEDDGEVSYAAHPLIPFIGKKIVHPNGRLAEKVVRIEGDTAVIDRYFAPDKPAEFIQLNVELSKVKE